MKADAATSQHSSVSLSPAEQERLACILDEYLAAMERGEPVSPEELLATHPLDAERLRAYLKGLEIFHTAAKPLAGTVAVEQPRAGRTVGDYDLLREIGRGGMGVVYDALERSLKRRVALKILPFAAAQDRRHLARFKNEAQAAAQAQHPNIVPVFGVGEADGVHYYAMQLIEGESLACIIRRHSCGSRAAGSTLVNNTKTKAPASESASSLAESAEPAAPRRASSTPAGLVETAAHVKWVARIGVQAAQGLHAAHEFGVVHRDVKPSNLLVDRDGKLWITDFGLARFRDAGELTCTGDILGTMRYMSPEQALGQAALIDHRTDVYSLGVTLYELATFVHPAEAAGVVELFLERTRANYRSLRHWNPHMPPDFETIVLKAMGEFPQDRYLTAAEMADDLGRFLRGEPILACRPSWTSRAAKWARRRRATMAVAAGAVCLAVVGLAASLIVIAGEKANVVAESQKREAALRVTRDALDEFTIVLGERLATVNGAEAVRRQAYEAGINYYRQVAEQAKGDPSFAVDYGMALGKLGELTAKIGDAKKALALLLDARNEFERLTAEDPGNDEYVRRFALSCNNAGLQQSRMGNFDEALVLLRQAEQLQVELASKLGDPRQLAIDVAATHSNLGIVLDRQGNKFAAREHLLKAVKLQRRTLAEDPENVGALRQLAESLSNAGALQRQTDLKAAVETFWETIDIQRRLLEREPLNQTFQVDLARAYNNLGYALSRDKEWGAAEECYRDAIDFQSKLVALAPQSLHIARDLAVSLNNLGMVQSKRNENLVAAERSFLQARDWQLKVVEAYPDDSLTLSRLGGVYNNLAILQDKLNRLADAETNFKLAIERQRRAVALGGDRQAMQQLLSKHYFNYAENLAKQGRHAEAREAALARRELCQGDSERLLSAAEHLAALSRIAVTGSANNLATAEGERTAAAAIETLRLAVAAGLSPASLSSPALASLASRGDFFALRRAGATDTHSLKSLANE